MQVTTNARYGKLADGPLARPIIEKRRSKDRHSRSRAEPIPRNADLGVSPIDINKLNEAEVIARAQNGDRLAFERLYRSHNQHVYAVCLRMVGNAAEAEDLTQEVFLLVLRKIYTFRGDSAFSTWLHRLTVNLVLMHLRKKSPPIVPIEVSPDCDDEIAPASIDFGVPDLSLEGAIDRINLGRCIAQLPSGYRAVFVLHDVQGYEHHEIAGILGRSVGVSKSQLHKARARLRAALHEVQRGKARDERRSGVKLRTDSSEILLASTDVERRPLCSI
jgi:RNA polymerase sigma-70 factor (ECF subfamily)